MKRLFTALFAAVFAFALAAPATMHNAAAAGKDEVTQPGAAMDNAMSGDKGDGKMDKKSKKHHAKKHHAKIGANRAKTTEEAKTNGTKKQPHAHDATGTDKSTGQ